MTRVIFCSWTGSRTCLWSPVGYYHSGVSCQRDALHHFSNHTILIYVIRSIPKVKTDSILKGWSSDIAFVRTCIAGAITRSKTAGKGIEPSELREAVWEASKGGPPRYLCKYTECANERPSFLVCVMLQLKSMLGDQQLRIFDAAAGWGDRLIAAMAVDAARYVGVDPNSNSKSCFVAAVEAIKGRDGHAKYEVLCDGCPGVVLPSDCVDESMNVAFLSPPAFDSEFYSDDVSALFCYGRNSLVCELFTGGPKRQRVPGPGGLAGSLRVAVA
jgi:hypothetical protein